LPELATEVANFLRFARSVSVVSQNATLPVAFSTNDADNCKGNLAVQARGTPKRTRTGAAAARRKQCGDSVMSAARQMSRRKLNTLDDGGAMYKDFAMM